MVRLIMGVGMIVKRVCMTVLVRMDDDLPGRIASPAVLGADLPCTPAFRAFFGFCDHGVRIHGNLLRVSNSGSAAPAPILPEPRTLLFALT
jgi:hypothetical protein